MPGIYRSLRAIALLVCAGILFFSLPARAQYPNRPVQIVVPFAAGSAPDIFGRLIAERLSLTLGAPVVIQNIPGAGGNIGVAHVAKSPADGHTLVLAGDASIVVNPAIYPTLPFDPQRDLAPISQLVVTPNVLVVGTQVPATDLKSLIALARSQPGKLSFASAGAGTSSHRAGELLQRRAGLQLIHVPYRTSALPDVIAGNVTMFFASTATAMDIVKEGRLRAIAVSSLQRTSMEPDLPTVSELGFPEFDAVAWFGLLAPANTPQVVIKQLHEAVRKALDQPALRQRLAGLGAEVIGSSPEEFTRLIAAETPRWSRLMKEAGIKAD